MTEFACDGCHKKLDHKLEKYVVVYVETHNYANLMYDDDCDEYVYCESCAAYMWRAIGAIPEIVKAKKKEEG